MKEWHKRAVDYGRHHHLTLVTTNKALCKELDMLMIDVIYL